MGSRSLARVETWRASGRVCVDEFTFRLNEGNVAIHTLDRLDSFVDGTADKRLTYKRLIACQN